MSRQCGSKKSRFDLFDFPQDPLAKDAQRGLGSYLQYGQQPGGMILCVSFLLIPDPAADTTRTVSGIRLCCYANKLANNRDQHGPLVSRIVSRISACETIVV